MIWHILIFLCSLILKTHQSCYLPFVDFPDKEPVLLHTDYSLINPKGTGVALNSNEEVIIACPGNSGSKNYFLNSSLSNPVLAKCAYNQTFDINGVLSPFTALNCSKSVTGDVFIPNNNTNPVIKEIGYNITRTNWAKLFFVYYNDSRGETIYSEHILYGSAIPNAKKTGDRPTFKVAGLGSGVTADAYKQATQKSTFTTLLGSSELADKYINTNSYLARGHLAPDGDFVYVSSQFTTYFYINTVPQWQAINNGNWKSLEISIRDTAATLKKDLTIITGGFQTLLLPDVNGNDQEIYLVTNKKLPVPKYVWKIAYSPDTKEGIAFVCLNNPFKDAVVAEDYICRDICEEHGWGTSAWKNATKGPLYCCDVNELRKVVTSIPQFDVNGVLNKPIDA